jgi:hypothetical protein
MKKRTKPNAAYAQLRHLGMRPTLARYFLVGLRRAGFVLVKEKELVTTKKINRQIEIIIKLMKLGNRRKAP